jgi:hypothetical protein
LALAAAGKIPAVGLIKLPGPLPGPLRAAGAPWSGWQGQPQRWLASSFKLRFVNIFDPRRLWCLEGTTLEQSMATQIVMDQTGDARHYFDAEDTEAVSKAEERFRLLTSIGFTACGSWRFWQCQRDTFVRSSGRRNAVLSETYWRLKVVIMLTQQLTSATRYLWRLLVEGARKAQVWRERLKTIEDIREARGITLLRQWLSPEQQAQFDASKCFDVVGCDSGRRYRIRYSSGTNVHEINDAGQPIMGWCFVPLGCLVAGDVMLAQKIALETDERAALAVANRIPPQLTGASHRPSLSRRAY